MLPVVLLYLCSLLIEVVSPNPSLSEVHNNRLSRRVEHEPGPQRRAFLVFDESIDIKYRVNGMLTFPSHSFIYYGPTEIEGFFRFEIALNTEVAPAERGFHLKGFDAGVKYGIETLNKNKKGRMVVELQDSTMRNAEIWENAKAAFAADPVYRSGPAHINFQTHTNTLNNCGAFLKRYMAMFHGPKTTTQEDNATSMFQRAERYNSIKPSSRTVRMRRSCYTTPSGPKNDEYAQAHPHRQIEEYPADCKRKVKRDATCKPKSIPIDVKGPIGPDYNTLAEDFDMKDLPKEFLLLDPFSPGEINKEGSDNKEVPNSEKRETFVRSGGKLTSFTAVSKKVFQGLDMAETRFGGPAFVMLEIVAKNWKAVAWGAATAAVEIVTQMFAPAGPVGWFIDIVANLLFAVLPGLFKDPKPWAARTDVRGIIQRTIWGDKDKTGNEECQKGTDDIPGNPDCQALFHPGTLPETLGFNNFDATVFVIEFNQGYAMTIKDMVAAFHVVDESKEGDGDDKKAIIKCHNSLGTPVNWVGFVDGDDSKKCAHPEYVVNRHLIKLPQLGGATANDILKRIITQDGGDCVLVNYAGTFNLQPMNFKLSGLPSDIPCGITDPSKVDGDVLPIGTTKPIASDNHNQPSSRTPFAPLEVKKYTCLAYDDHKLCLPPGKYSKQSGCGFEIRSVKTLTFPETGNWELAVHWKHAYQHHSQNNENQYTNQTYTKNQSPPSESSEFYEFASDMEGVGIDNGDDATFTITPKAEDPGKDPICCLYTEVKFKGNVWCGGIGSDDLDEKWQGKAQSIKCLGGSQVWISAEKYADWDPAAPLIGTLEDLSEQFYGEPLKKETYSERVKAVWIVQS